MAHKIDQTDTNPTILSMQITQLRDRICGPFENKNYQKKFLELNREYPQSCICRLVDGTLLYVQSPRYQRSYSESSAHSLRNQSFSFL